MLRLLRRRSITLHLCVLLVITVGAVVAGVLGIAKAMFISAHDRDVVLAGSSAVSLTLGWWLGRPLAAEAVWAHPMREQERQSEAGRRELIAWVSHDLRTPLAGLRAMAEAFEDGVIDDRATGSRPVRPTGPAAGVRPAAGWAWPSSGASSRRTAVTWTSPTPRRVAGSSCTSARRERQGAGRAPAPAGSAPVRCYARSQR
jgi:signal transduction histidine kinase